MTNLIRVVIGAWQGCKTGVQDWCVMLPVALIVSAVGIVSMVMSR